MQGAHQFVRLQEAAEGGVRENLVGAVGERAVRIGEQRAVLVRQQEAGGDGVHADALTVLDGELAGKPFRPAGHSRLGDSVARHAGERPERRHRAEIDDGSLLLLHHRLDEHLGGDHRTEDVEFADLLHRVDVKVGDGLVRLHVGRAHIAAGGIQQNVDGAVRFENIGQVLLQGLLVEHIGREEHRLSPIRLDFINQQVALFGRPFEVEQDHFAALRGEILDNRGAQDPAGPGHHHHFSFDVE